MRSDTRDTRTAPGLPDMPGLLNMSNLPGLPGLPGLLNMSDPRNRAAPHRAGTRQFGKSRQTKQT